MRRTVLSKRNTPIIYRLGGFDMDYDKYEELYQKTVEKGIRPQECKASEEEWQVLSDISQESILLRLQREIEEFIWD